MFKIVLITEGNNCKVYVLADSIDNSISNGRRKRQKQISSKLYLHMCLKAID